MMTSALAANLFYIQYIEEQADFPSEKSGFQHLLGPQHMGVHCYQFNYATGSH